MRRRPDNGVQARDDIRVAAGLGVAVILGCSPGPADPTDITERWYTSDHVAAGVPVYARHCAGCHGAAGEGAPDWQQPALDGLWPAPPLNGTGHAWHHPLRQLYAMIHDGSPPGRGRMPAWGGQLSRAEILAVVARFQSWWPDEIYTAWDRMNRTAVR